MADKGDVFGDQRPPRYEWGFVAIQEEVFRAVGARWGVPEFFAGPHDDPPDEPLIVHGGEC